MQQPVDIPKHQARGLIAMTASVAENFLKYDYAETKDLLKTFITLISGTLVISLTFSEKVVVFSRADSPTQFILFSSWALFISALIFSGIGLCFIAAAAGKIIYGAIPVLNYSYYTLALVSWAFTLVAGVTYIAGLVTLAIAAAKSLSGPV